MNLRFLDASVGREESTGAMAGGRIKTSSGKTIPSYIVNCIMISLKADDNIQIKCALD